MSKTNIRTWLTFTISGHFLNGCQLNQTPGSTNRITEVCRIISSQQLSSPTPEAKAETTARPPLVSHVLSAASVGACWRTLLPAEVSATHGLLSCHQLHEVLWPHGKYTRRVLDEQSIVYCKKQKTERGYVAVNHGNSEFGLIWQTYLPV